jgi:hypothetical protein
MPTDFKKVSRGEFDSFLAVTATLTETSYERDGEFAYENWLNMGGEPVAFAAYRDGEAEAFYIAQSP